MIVSTASPQRALALSTGAILAVCAMAGVACAVAVWFNAQLVIVASFLMLMTAAALLLFGAATSIILLSVLIALFLMNRFDEGFAFSIDPPVALPASLWACLLFALCLGFLALVNRDKAQPSDPLLASFNSRFARRWTLFCLLGLVSVLFNHFADDDMPLRDLTGEVWALVLVAFPLAFVQFIALSKLSRSRTLFCLRCLIALAALSGLIMTLFGVLPDSIMGRLGWVRAIGGTSDLVRGRLPMGHPNRVAAMMLTMLPLATLTALGGRGFFWRVFSAVSACLIGCGVLFTLSRAALLNMVLILGLTYLMFFFTQKHRRGTGVVFILISGLIALSVGSVLLARYDFSRLWSRGYYEDASVSRRHDSLNTSFYVWFDHPLLGIGPDSVYPRLDLRPGWTPPMADTISPIIYYKSRLTAETPHNFYMHALAEFGLVGGLVFFSLIFLVLHTLWHARGTPGIDLPEKELITGLALGIAAMLFSGLFEAVFMSGTRGNILFWIYAGLAVRYVMTLSAERAPCGESAP